MATGRWNRFAAWRVGAQRRDSVGGALEQGSDTEEDEELEFCGKFGTQIVGVQYYAGTVNTKEMVQLVRDPNNRYDKWAIRVDNIHGEQVGHIGRNVVCHMAPLVDQGIVQFEGVVPFGARNVYKIPVDIYCFCKPANRNTVTARLQIFHLQWSSRGGPSQVASPSRGRASAAEVAESLEKMFEDLLQETQLKDAMLPNPGVTSSLYRHQQEALAWMVQRENSDVLPPFWEVHKSKGKSASSEAGFVNTLTNFISSQRPAPFRGGILSDEMGLGKTLELISLILTNRPGAPPPVVAGAAEAEPQGQEDAPPLAKKRKVTKAKKRKQENAIPETSQPVSALPSELSGPNGPQGTLVVCPVSVLSNWQQQLEEHTSGDLTWYTYHGSDRVRSAKALAKYDVVLTTYAILSTELGLKNGILKVPWLRVILDEAHVIRNASTRQARAARELQAPLRWAVTGTPLQNKLHDLHGLLAFLGLQPLNERGFFTRTIERPIREQDTQGLKRLKVLMGTIALRRTKDLVVNGAPIVSLPPKTIRITRVNLSPQDRLKYDRFEMEARRLVSQHLETATLMQNYSCVLEAILRLRQICDHGDLCPFDTMFGAGRGEGKGKGKRKAGEMSEAVMRLMEILKAGGGDECSICLNDMELPCITPCAHAFCQRCIEAALALSNPCCPLCRGQLSLQTLVPVPVDCGDSEGKGSEGPSWSRAGAKIDELMKCLKRHVGREEAGNRKGAPPKAVVFSQFNGMLDMVEAQFVASGIAYVRLDGSTPSARRSEIVRNFASCAASSPRVFLASLRTGGVGMNLTAASQDRVHRLGQRSAVEVFRYVCQGTIEERMLAMQESKKGLVSAAFDKRNPDQQRQARIDDIKLLMEL